MGRKYKSNGSAAVLTVRWKDNYVVFHLKMALRGRNML
jgi:hypothetical protein